MNRKTVQIFMPEDLHQELKDKAKKENTYLNSFYIKILEVGLKNFLPETLTVRKLKKGKSK